MIGAVVQNRRPYADLAQSQVVVQSIGFDLADALRSQTAISSGLLNYLDSFWTVNWGLSDLVIEHVVLLIVPQVHDDRIGRESDMLRRDSLTETKTGSDLRCSYSFVSIPNRNQRASARLGIPEVFVDERDERLRLFRSILE